MKQQEHTESLRLEFIKEFCNDHNGQVRWLRSVALTEQDLLDKILAFFDVHVKE